MDDVYDDEAEETGAPVTQVQGPPSLRELGQDIRDLYLIYEQLGEHLRDLEHEADAVKAKAIQARRALMAQ